MNGFRCSQSVIIHGLHVCQWKTCCPFIPRQYILALRIFVVLRKISCNSSTIMIDYQNNEDLFMNFLLFFSCLVKWAYLGAERWDMFRISIVKTLKNVKQLRIQYLWTLYSSW
jgi:hypothetical protein